MRLSGRLNDVSRSVGGRWCITYVFFGWVLVSLRGGFLSGDSSLWPHAYCSRA